MTTFTTSSATGSNQFLQSYVRQVQVALDEYGRYEYYTMVTCSHENKTGKGKGLSCRRIPIYSEVGARYYCSHHHKEALGSTSICHLETNQEQQYRASLVRFSNICYDYLSVAVRFDMSYLGIAPPPRWCDPFHNALSHYANATNIPMEHVRFIPAYSFLNLCIEHINPVSEISSLFSNFVDQQSNAPNVPTLEGDCIVCLLPIQTNDASRPCTTCKNTFHDTCMILWQTTSNTCPTCRNVWDIGLTGYFGTTGTPPGSPGSLPDLVSSSEDEAM